MASGKISLKEKLALREPQLLCTFSSWSFALASSEFWSHESGDCTCRGGIYSNGNPTQWGIKSCLPGITVVGSPCLLQSLLLKSVAYTLAQPHKNGGACFCGTWRYQTFPSQSAIDWRWIHDRRLVIKICSATLQTCHCSLFAGCVFEVILKSQGAMYIIHSSVWCLSHGLR